MESVWLSELSSTCALAILNNPAVVSAAAKRPIRGIYLSDIHLVIVTPEWCVKLNKSRVNNGLAQLPFGELD